MCYGWKKRPILSFDEKILTQLRKSESYIIKEVAVRAPICVFPLAASLSCVVECGADLTTKYVHNIVEGAVSPYLSYTVDKLTITNCWRQAEHSPAGK